MEWGLITDHIVTSSIEALCLSTCFAKRGAKVFAPASSLVL
jgi:hypothetical protein